MLSRFIGGILLIVGTSIGAGMLALPIANAATGFWQSSVFLLLVWAFMTLGAFYLLEANLYLPPGKHMVSMAQETLGSFGLLAAWISYLLLLYSLISAYISGGADVLNHVLSKAGIDLNDWQASSLFTLLFGLIVYGGIHSVDIVNRLLMFGKLAVYLLLVFLIAPFVSPLNLLQGDYTYVAGIITILITSFGFAIIVPNLRDYFNDDINTLKKVIFIGSLIPLVCYIAWDAVIMGTIPPKGDSGLIQLMQDPHATSSLATLISQRVSSKTITTFFNFFTSICMLTAFLGVSLCLYSFLADGLKLRPYGHEGVGLFFLTFLPPLLIVLFYPGAYIQALGYAGVFCIILLLLLPALMCYFGRKKYSPPFKVPGGNYPIYAVALVSIALLLNEGWSIVHALLAH